MTYSVKGVQYVAILAGWGGVYDVAPGILSGKSGSVRNISRLLVFKIGGKAVLPPPPPQAKQVLDPPPFTGTKAQADAGMSPYQNSCSVCHGDAGSQRRLRGRHARQLREGAALGLVRKGVLHKGVQ
jgi:alcohol dehydrogenase (cytochrome c)/quinohemoprotein ethanol dehydrogenase